MKQYLWCIFRFLPLIFSVTFCVIVVWHPSYIYNINGNIASTFLTPIPRNIIFIRTSSSPLEQFELCCLYAAAFHNPKWNVILLSFESFQVPTYLSNLHNFKQINTKFDDIFARTPLQTWFKSGLWKVPELVKRYRFLSDAARLAYLYKYGGVYMDTDLISLEPLSEELSSSVALQNPISHRESLGNTFLAFHAKHPFLESVMKRQAAIFNPKKKENLYSVVLYTRIYKEMVKNGNDENVPSLLSTKKIFPILYENAAEILQQKDEVGENELKKLNEALTVHIWRNKLRTVLNRPNPIPLNGSVLYDVAEKNCPHTLKDWK